MPPLIDLTLTVSPKLRGVEFESKHTHQRDGFNTRTLHLYSHSGTHMDAPLHFAAGEGTIDRIPLSHCVLPAWVADITHLAPRALIAVSDLGPVAEQVQQMVHRVNYQAHRGPPEFRPRAAPRGGIVGSVAEAERIANGDKGPSQLPGFGEVAQMRG